jgi:hypothetical protein
MGLCEWNMLEFHDIQIIWLYTIVGVIVYCGMERASISYLMYVGSQGSQITDQFMVYFWLRLNL